MYSAAFTLLSLLPAALSLPRFYPRQVSEPWCAGFGGGAFDISYNFTLTAYNITDATLGPFTQVGDPLVVGIKDEYGAVSVGVLATAASVTAAALPYGPSPFLGFNLTSGELQPLPAPGLSYSVYSSDYESSGGEPAFQFSELSWELDPPAQIYCGIANTDPAGGGNPHPQLAIDDETDNFYLCADNLGYNEVVHNPSAKYASEFGYDLDTCYPVTVHIIDAY